MRSHGPGTYVTQTQITAKNIQNALLSQGIPWVSINVSIQDDLMVNHFEFRCYI